MRKNAFAASAPPRTPLGELLAFFVLPHPLAGFGGGGGWKRVGKEKQKKKDGGRENEGRNWANFWSKVAS